MAYNIKYIVYGVYGVGFIRKLEELFEKNIEGFFSAKFGGELQPVEIAKRLSKEMEKDKTVGVSQVYVPNQFSVFLSKADYERLTPYGQAIRDEIAAYVAEEAKRKKYTIVGKPMIDIFTDSSLQQGRFTVASHYTEPIPEEPSVSGPKNAISDTQVFAKVGMPVRKSVCITGLLTVVSGLDAGLQTEIGTDRVNIGRWESNELPMTDMNTSRLHAYISYEEGGHMLYDAKSLNGTYVNSHRITRKRLKNGDKIKMGNTVVLYEVK